MKGDERLTHRWEVEAFAVGIPSVALATSTEALVSRASLVAGRTASHRANVFSLVHAALSTVIPAITSSLLTGSS